MAKQNQPSLQEESVEEIVEEQEPETFADNSADLEEEQLDEKLDSFGRMVRATMRGGKTADYITKKAKERSDLNKKNDPGSAKKGYALSVTDKDKAMAKARKKGLSPKHPTTNYNRKLPEEEVLEQKNCGCGKNPCETYGTVQEKTLTPAEKKKREEIAKAIERDNPKMPMDKKMAIATATAKKVAESLENRHKEALGQVFKHMDQVKSKVHKAKFQKRFDKHLDTYDHSFSSGGERAVKGLNDIANDIKKHNSKVSESSISDRTKRLIERAINRKT
jgi:hypothetical protein